MCKDSTWDRTRVSERRKDIYRELQVWKLATVIGKPWTIGNKKKEQRKTKTTPFSKIALNTRKRKPSRAPLPTKSIPFLQFEAEKRNDEDSSLPFWKTVTRRLRNWWTWALFYHLRLCVITLVFCPAFPFAYVVPKLLKMSTFHGHPYQPYTSIYNFLSLIKFQYNISKKKY